MQIPCFLKCAFGIFFVIVVSLITTLTLIFIQRPKEDVTIMTWNILAPMWIDREAVGSRGVVDMNLLNDEVRLLFVMDRVMTQQPDILHLQEVQEDTFETIKNGIAESYTAVAFASNINGYWRSYLSGNHSYIKNGVATFYKKDRFDLISHKEIQTSPLGSVALLAVVQPKKNTRIDSKLALVNCHLETGVTRENVTTRVIQGNAIMREIEKEFPAQQSQNSDSVVIIAGDFNTQSPYPGFTNFKTNGFLDAAQEVSQTAFPTFYFERSIPVTENKTTDWVSIDHVFIRNAEKSTGKLKVTSVDVPGVDSQETTLKFYVDKLTKILKKNLESPEKTQSWRILNSEFYRTVQAADQNPQEIDHSTNRVLRLGSDHLPVTVKLDIR